MNATHSWRKITNKKNVDGFCFYECRLFSLNRSTRAVRPCVVTLEYHRYVYSRARGVTTHTGVRLNLLKLCWLVEWRTVSHTRAFLFHAVEQRDRVFCVRYRATTLFSSEKIMPLLRERHGLHLRSIGHAEPEMCTRGVNCFPHKSRC